MSDSFRIGYIAGFTVLGANIVISLYTFFPIQRTFFGLWWGIIPTATALVACGIFLNSFVRFSVSASGIVRIASTILSYAFYAFAFFQTLWFLNAYRLFITTGSVTDASQKMMDSLIGLCVAVGIVPAIIYAIWMVMNMRTFGPAAFAVAALPIILIETWLTGWPTILLTAPSLYALYRAQTGYSFIVPQR